MLFSPISGFNPPSLKEIIMMIKKTYTTPSTIEHGGAAAMTLGGGITSTEGGSQLGME